MTYTILPRLIDAYTRTEFAQLVSGYLDLATAYDVYDQFCLRRLNTIEDVNGVNVWELHLKNQLRLIAEQYKAYLRVQTTDFDPMVSEYVERQILTTSHGTDTTTLNHSTTRTDDLTTAQTGSSTPGVTETRRTIAEGTIGGTDNTDRGETLDRTSTETRNTTRTDDLSDTVTHNTTETATTDQRAISAQLPHSITHYTTGTAGRDSGIPSDLGWDTATAQQESDGKTTTSRTGTDKTDHEGTVKDTGTVTTAETGSPTGYDRNTYGQESSGETTETITRTGRDATTNQTTHTGTQSSAVSGIDTVGRQKDDDVRERMTGRHGQAPAEMLEKARTYILRTNAFEWLCNQLNENFIWMEVYY